MKNNNADKYKVILDNLFEIKPNDSSVFTKIDNSFYFDLYKLFGQKRFNYICENKEFSLPIINVSLLQLLNLINEAKNAEEIEDLLLKHEQPLFESTKKLLYNDFGAGLKKINDQIKSTFQKSTIKWKIFSSRANEINNEINVWTIHLGFMYVSLTKNDSSIYAPLFFKEAFVRFRNGIPYLVCDGEIKINEKLQFILNNAGFNIEVDFDLSDYNINELVKKLHKEWKLLYNVKNDISNFFVTKHIDEIDNLTLRFHPGIVLGIFFPAGGYSRNRMKEIIDKNEIDSIFKIEFNKNEYLKFVENNIYNNNAKILKITPTNFSQDRAIISSLNQHTIIWGPPGTGKSQTIVNLLANIMHNEKTALVASQKKAALEVIRNRLGDLSCFCLFILSSRDMKIKNFYKPIKKYLDFLENETNEFEMQWLNVITQKEKEWIDELENYLKNPHYKEIIEGYFYLYNNIKNLSSEDINFVFSLPKNILYPQDEIKPRMDKILLKINKVLSIPFLKKYKFIKNLGKQINKQMANFKGNLAELIIKFRNINPNDLIWINNFLSKIPNFEKDDLSDIGMLKSYISNKIRKKVKKFIAENQQSYNDFAALARIGKMQPYKFIKECADVIKVVFPVIIATPHADLSKWEKEEFDYAIIDESSQMFIEQGLPLLYLSKIKILAGDEEQMKPTNWFGVRTTDDSIFGSVESVLDYANSLKIHSVLLDKNYRSNHASLMTFSSKYFYKSSLDVVDLASSLNTESAIEVIQVEGKWEENKNIEEAKTALQVIEENINKYNKIILLSFNAKQREYLENEIYSKHPAIENLINDRLLLRNIENIQGDEADLVVATVAYDKNTKISSTYVARPGGKNALNVAISRAKDKMVVIKTIKSDEIITNIGTSSDMFIFKNWLKFLELSDTEKKNYVKNSMNQKQILDLEKSKENNYLLIDEVEKELKKAIKNYENVKIIKNFSVGTINIDLVVFIDENIYKCFIFDNLNYGKNYKKYLHFKDYYKFLLKKNYSLIYINQITWLKDKQKILLNFNENKINIFKNSLHKIKKEKNEYNVKISDIIYSDNEKNNDELFKELTNEIELFEQLNK